MLHFLYFDTHWSAAESRWNVTPDYSVSVLAAVASIGALAVHNFACIFHPTSAAASKNRRPSVAQGLIIERLQRIRSEMRCAAGQSWHSCMVISLPIVKLR